MNSEAAPGVLAQVVVLKWQHTPMSQEPPV